MLSRSELEALILRGLQELRSLEANLDRRWAHLGRGSAQARDRFFRNLIDLETRVEQIERLTATLDEQPAGLPRAAA